MTIDCLLHVHSSFSYDSRTDLEDIARTAKRHGIACVLMSEHNNRMDDVQVAAFVQRCRELSDDTLLMIPGLELAYAANRVHLLAYGIRCFIASTGPECTLESLIDAVHEAGGLAVLAHPSHREAIELVSDADLKRLDGIEVWNVKNGNRYVPMASDVSLLNRVRASGGRAFAFGGLDWHHLNKFTRFVLRVDTSTLTEGAVLDSLRAGRFVIRGSYVSCPSIGYASRARLAAYRFLSGALARSRRAALRLETAVERRGIRVPKVLTAAARRVF